MITQGEAEDTTCRTLWAEMITKELFLYGDVYLDNRMHARKNCVTAAVNFSSLSFLTQRERHESEHTKLWRFGLRTLSALVYCIDTLLLY